MMCPQETDHKAVDAGEGNRDAKVYLGQLVNQLRVEAKFFRPSDLAAELGWNRTHVPGVENGYRTLGKARYLKLRSVLGDHGVSETGFPTFWKQLECADETPLGQNPLHPGDRRCRPLQKVAFMSHLPISAQNGSPASPVRPPCRPPENPHESAEKRAGAGDGT